MWKHHDSCERELTMNKFLIFCRLVMWLNFFDERFFLFAVQYVQKLFKYSDNTRTQICLLDENNYVYSIKNKTQVEHGFIVNWRCSSMKKSKCQARYSTFNDRLKSFRGEHNHAPTFCANTMILMNESLQWINLLTFRLAVWLTSFYEFV